MKHGSCKPVMVIPGLLLLIGCSAESFYHSTQQAHIQECRRLPVDQQAHCLSLNDTPYEEYRREREAD